MIFNTRQFPIFIISIILILLFSLTGCGDEKKTAQSNELQDVTLKLKWLHQAQFAGNYVAKEKGIYADNGLNVDIQQFSFDDSTINAVVEGRADFGITGADELLLARVAGKPIKAFAVIYKINPVCAYSLKESGITKPQDFIGKTVGIERAVDGTDVNVGILYYAMMSKVGVDRSQVNEVTIGYDATELLAGDTDVSTGYIINEPHQVLEADKEVNTILMADYGVNMYADVLFTTEDTLNNRPELVTAFLKATLDGWQYAIEHENEAVDAVLKYAPDRTRRHETYMMQQSVPLIHTGVEPLGWMTEEGWTKVQTILVEQGITEGGINVADLYDMRPLNEVYT